MMIIMVIMKMVIIMLIIMLIMMLDSCSVAAQYAGGWGLHDMRPQAPVDDMRPQPRQKKTLFRLSKIRPQMWQAV